MFRLVGLKEKMKLVQLVKDSEAAPLKRWGGVMELIVTQLQFARHIWSSCRSLILCWRIKESQTTQTTQVSQTTLAAQTISLNPSIF